MWHHYYKLILAVDLLVHMETNNPSRKPRPSIISICIQFQMGHAYCPNSFHQPFYPWLAAKLQESYCYNHKPIKKRTFVFALILLVLINFLLILIKLIILNSFAQSIFLMIRNFIVDKVKQIRFCLCYITFDKSYIIHIFFQCTWNPH